MAEEPNPPAIAPNPSAKYESLKVQLLRTCSPAPVEQQGPRGSVIGNAPTPWVVRRVGASRAAAEHRRLELPFHASVKQLSACRAARSATPVTGGAPTPRVVRRVGASRAAAEHSRLELPFHAAVKQPSARRAEKSAAPSRGTPPNPRQLGAPPLKCREAADRPMGLRDPQTGRGVRLHGS